MKERIQAQKGAQERVGRRKRRTHRQVAAGGIHRWQKHQGKKPTTTNQRKATNPPKGESQSRESKQKTPKGGGKKEARATLATWSRRRGGRESQARGRRWAFARGSGRPNPLAFAGWGVETRDRRRAPGSFATCACRTRSRIDQPLED